MNIGKFCPVSANVFVVKMGHIQGVNLVVREQRYCNARLDSKDHTAFSAEWRIWLSMSLVNSLKRLVLISRRWICANGEKRH